MSFINLKLCFYISTKNLCAWYNNVGSITDNQGKKAKRKVEVITNLLNNIGFDNIYT